MKNGDKNTVVWKFKLLSIDKLSLRFQNMNKELL